MIRRKGEREGGRERKGKGREKEGRQEGTGRERGREGGRKGQEEKEGGREEEEMRLAVVPEAIFSPSHHWELKAGVPGKGCHLPQLPANPLPTKLQAFPVSPPLRAGTIGGRLGDAPQLGAHERDA